MRLANRLIGCAVAAFCCAAAPAPALTPQGVFSHEIVVATHMDLSGPLALWGQAVRNGIAMAIDEANNAGGVQGRKIHLIVCDDKYQTKLATACVRTAVTQDHVFAILSPLGTPTVQATMPIALKHGVLHLFPLMANVQSYLPLHPLKFATQPPYAVEMEAGLHELLGLKRANKVGALYQDNAFGCGVREGVEAALARRGLKLAAFESYPEGAENLDAEIATLKAAHVEIVALGSVVQDTLSALRAAYRQAWRPIFLCPAACYTPETATLGGWLAEGLYGVGQAPIPYPDDPNPKLRAWAARYEKRFGTAPTVQALQGYLNARLFIDALTVTGPSPTQSAFAHSLETMGPWVEPQLGGLPVQFSATDHLGVHTGFLARVHNGRWVMQAGKAGRRERI